MEGTDVVETEVIALMGGSVGARSDELIRKGVPLDALDRLRKEHGIDAYGAGIINRRTHDHRRSLVPEKLLERLGLGGVAANQLARPKENDVA